MIAAAISHVGFLERGPIIGLRGAARSASVSVRVEGTMDLVLAVRIETLLDLL
ncbi:hypothetical protein [Micromonospora sp. NPDC002717]|uniref:hypothetical protein n=1 Tax=Micromonospora sp. NPDC002717 TaxID=3154424 RepID=UPI0033305B67